MHCSVPFARMIEARRLSPLALTLLVAASCGGGGKGRVATPKPPAPPILERVSDLAARVPRGKRIALRALPGGRVLAHLGSKTEFGSPQMLSVAFRKGRWLAVRS